jgi:hypothetical protein
MSEDELEALRSKNRELLDELKKARAKSAELETLQEQLTAAKTEVLELKLHQPVRALLDQVLIPPNKFAIAEVMDDYKFQLDDDGKIQMLGSDDKAVEFAVESVTDFLGGVEKYAGVVRAMARNETVESAPQAKRDNPKTHFGIR